MGSDHEHGNDITETLDRGLAFVENGLSSLTSQFKSAASGFVESGNIAKLDGYADSAIEWAGSKLLEVANGDGMLSKIVNKLFGGAENVQSLVNTFNEFAAVDLQAKAEEYMAPDEATGPVRAGIAPT